MNTAFEEEPPMSAEDQNADLGALDAFALGALSHDSLDDAVTLLLFEHVVEGRYDPSVIAAELSRLLEDLMSAVELEDCMALAALLVAGVPREEGMRAARESAGPEYRLTGAGTRIDIGLIREFLWMAVTHPAAKIRLQALLANTAQREGDRALVVAKALPWIVEDLRAWLDGDDWRRIADRLIAEAREVDGQV